MRLQLQSVLFRAAFAFACAGILLASASPSKAQGLTSTDLIRFRFVGDAVLSPDSHRIAYTVIIYDRPGRPSPQLWIMDLATQKSVRIGDEKDVAGNPHWSPDGKQIAFISSTPDERAAEANGDPMVITRYLYKPTAGEGMSRFNDNQRLHVFAVDVATKQVRQLTQGGYDEHSIDWSPSMKKWSLASSSTREI